MCVQWPSVSIEKAKVENKIVPTDYRSTISIVMDIEMVVYVAVLTHLTLHNPKHNSNIKTLIIS